MNAPGQHRLRRLQLINWGTFDHYLDLPVPRSGLLITGESGSGKSTLLDALAAVLVRPAKLRLNAAAQEGGAGDRSRNLLTYVRGAYKREADANSGEPVTAYLRPGAAWSAICLTYSNGLGKITSLIRLLHVVSSANSAKDVRSLFVVAEEEVELNSLEPYAENGLDMRRMKAAFPSWVVSSEYSGFAQKMQRCFGLENEQAQLLLHKTQSAKNLTSLDVLLRDFMLDPPETFELADQAIEQFDELSAAHHAVVDARRQTETLSKLDDLAERRQALIEQNRALTMEQTHLEAFTLQRRIARADVELEKLTQRLAALENEVVKAEKVLASRRADQEIARRRVDGLGGRDLDILRQEKDFCAQRLASTQERRTKLAAVAREAGLELPSAADQQGDFLKQVERCFQELDESAPERESRYALTAHADQVKRDREQIEQQLRTLETQRSALDGRLLDLRAKLVEAAGVEPERLGFAGELISVRAEESQWTGAIERVLRSLAQTLLVPEELYPLVSEYVDRNHLGMRLVYLRVPQDFDAASDPKDGRSLVYKVAVGEGESSEWLRSELIHRFDYLCVPTASELRGAKRGVTLAGQVKHSATRHEKDDRGRIDDPSTWMLGSSIEMKRAALQAELKQLRTQESEATRQRDERDDDYGKRQSLMQRLSDLRQLEWASIDVEGVREEFDELDARIDALHASNGGLLEAQGQLKQAELALDETEKMLTDCRNRHTREQQNCEQKQQHRDEAAVRLAELAPVPDAVAQSLTTRFEQTGLTQPEMASRQVGSALREEEQKISGKLRTVESSCVGVMNTYRTQWPGPAADLACEIDYLDEYLVILRNLRADRLPEFEDRFFTLLQKQSRNNIGTIARMISRSRSEIRSRVDPINRSLEQTQYAPGKHLKLRVIDSPTRDVREFLDDLNAIASGSLEDTMILEPNREERERAEERFLRLERLLKRMASSEDADKLWRKQCLDTRLHVKFRADVIDADTHELGDVYTGAGGLSGGERQKLVVFCLAAALRYQLAREGSGQPSYGLVILDEAFDKTDPAFTKAGLDVFDAFGFQMLLATPLKMLQTLEAYVGGAVQVSSRENEGSRCEKLIWEVSDEDNPL
ncbi:MAG: AAA family ATPase [Coriobacteriales bacterium]|jgi:uncharacterized protein YPO0396|nr:AAA family ATPase [Coriobacteriales bacterium]